MTKTVDIYVIDETSSGKAIKCSMTSSGEDPFYLPKSQIKPHGSVKKANFNKFDIPDWLFLEHRQMCGTEAFEERKREKMMRELG